MSKISFIYFDVGGVAIKDFSDTNMWDRMIDNALGIPSHQREAFDELFDKYEDDICEGKIYVDDLKPFIKAKFNPALPDDFSLLDYFVDNFEANNELWPTIIALKESHRLGLLTDQYPGMFTSIIKAKLFPPVDWEIVIDSSQVSIRKPKPAIYELAQQQAAVPPSEILFIDNREKNLVPARELGWQTFLYDSSDYAHSTAKLKEFLQNL